MKKVMVRIMVPDGKTYLYKEPGILKRILNRIFKRQYLRKVRFKNGTIRLRNKQEEKNDR